MYDKLYSEGNPPPPSLPHPSHHLPNHLLRPPPLSPPLLPVPSPLTPPLEAINASLSTLSLDAQKRAEKDSEKKAAKAALLEAREAETKASSIVYIKRVERNKRKFVTAVSGLEAQGMDLKKVAKEWGKKFATVSGLVL